MTDCVGCGDCCENLPLNTPERADIWAKRLLARAGAAGSSGRARRAASWMAQLIPVGEPQRRENGEWRWRYRCPLFDPVTRRCTDYANRPYICRDYPHYGRTPEPYDGGSMSPRCSFNADHRTMLPIVAVTSRPA